MTFIDSIKTYRVQFIVTLLLLAGLYYPVVPSMVKQWYDDPNYSHGFLVPLIAGYFLSLRLQDLKKVPVRPARKGLFLLISGLLMLALAYVGTELFTMRASLIVVVAGIILYLFGTDVLKTMALPVGYLIFMVPLPAVIYDSFAFPLKLFVTKYSVLFLKATGVIVWREGNIIMLPDTVLEVADACSGMRSIMSLLALSVAFAFVSQRSKAKRLILILSAIPIAIVTNSCRVIVTGILAQHWGAAAAEGFFHEFAGMAVFGLGIVLLVSLGALLRRIGK